MLWRVRTSLEDRPGALALLAEQCGLAEVNILGLQIFPGVESVTDELVLRTPDGWGSHEIGRLVESAGGREVVAAPCSEEALADQATLYVQAARAILADPMTFPSVVGRLFDARLESVTGEAPDESAIDDDVMQMTVGDVEVQVRREAPFTATEHARGAALAALVGDVLATVQAGRVTPTPDPRGGSTAPTYAVDGDSIVALVEGIVIGRATLQVTQEDGVLSVGLDVDPAWQRRGIGSRLLIDAARLANSREAEAILLTTESDNPAVLPMTMSAGLRGRIRMAGDQLTVRIAVGDLKPLSR